MLHICFSSLLLEVELNFFIFFILYSVCCPYRERENWEKAIEEWQEPVLSDPELPAWFKSGTEELIAQLFQLQLVG